MLEHFSRWLRRYKGVEANPVYRLAVDVATGRTTFERAMASVQSYNIIAGLADGDLIELDRQAEFETRTNFEFGLLLSQLNAAAARAKGFEKVYVDLCLRVADLFESVARLPERDYYLREAVKAAQRTSYISGERRVTGRLARQAYERGDMVEARRLWTSQLEAGRDDADGRDEVETALLLANLAMTEGDSASAYDLYTRAGKSGRRLGLHAEVVESLLAQSTISRERGEMDTALMLLNQAQESAERTVDVRLRGQVAYRTGALLCDMNRPSEALPILENAIDLATEEGDPTLESSALNLVANIAQQTGDQSQARQHYERLAELEEGIGNRVEAGRALCQLGALHFDANRLDEAYRVLVDARAISSHADDPDFTIQVHGLLGSVLAAQGREREALEALEVAVAGSHSAGDYAAEARWLVAAGEAMLRFGGTDEAASLAIQAEELARIDDDQVLYAQVHALNGQIALARGSLAEATAAYQQAVYASNMAGQPRETLRYLPLLARLTLESGAVDRALEHLAAAIEVAEQLDEQRTLCSLYGQTARIHQRRENYDEAVIFYRSALDVASDLNDDSLVARATQGLATSLDTGGRTEEAVANYRLAIEATERIGDMRAASRIHYNLGAIYADNNRDDMARRHLMRARETAESVQDHDLADLAESLLGMLRPVGTFYDHIPEDPAVSEEPVRPRDYPMLH